MIDSMNLKNIRNYYERLGQWIWNSTKIDKYLE